MAKPDETLTNTGTIVDCFLAMEIGQALLLHRVVGAVLNRMARGLPAAATLVRSPETTTIVTGATDTGAGLAQAPPVRRRRRRTRAEVTAEAGPASETVDAGDPGIPPEEIGNG